ncbi:hypothetical protein [Rhizobium sp. MHM7A]|uniref:hypothetical protein n=1 Tax=Rhizobium sp. MHM7A TaxID=2583233 RepID=UPI001105EE24|nr:hypothetical protein [Rhizobium sp. MHM7A]TLX16332.1 hypothetical protein FFR93_03100 [Rhizobium sp. MHM7A]
MRLRLPIDYTITAALRANSLGKKYAVIEAVEVNIQEIDRDDFPMAVSWQQKSLPWDEPVGRRHTCFIAGDHWRPLGSVGGDQVRFSDDAIANQAAINNLLPKGLKRNSRILEAASDEKRSITLQGESLPILDAEKIANVELDSLDLSNQFQARFELHRKASDLLLCDGVLYHRVGEPVLTANLTSEHRPPDTLTLTVGDTTGSYANNARERQLPLYTHRIDRLDDFRTVFDDRKPTGNYEVYDLIEDIEVYRPDVLRFEDDMECLDSLLAEVRSGLSALPNQTFIQDAVELHRRVSRKLKGSEKVELLSELADHPTLFKGSIYADLKSRIDLVNDRWRFRPITKLSM